MKTTPYNTGKILIGCNYTPPVKRQPLSRTEAMLQSAMLDDAPEIDWGGIWIVVGFAFLMAAPYLFFAWRAA